MGNICCGAGDDSSGDQWRKKFKGSKADKDYFYPTQEQLAVIKASKGDIKTMETSKNLNSPEMKDASISILRKDTKVL